MGIESGKVSKGPEFPITVRWNEDGEVESYDDEKTMVCDLEFFDSEDPDYNVEVTDRLGRRVRLVVDHLKLVEFRLRDA